MAGQETDEPRLVVNVKLRIGPRTHDALRELADRYETSMASVMRRAIREFLLAERNREQQEG